MSLMHWIRTCHQLVRVKMIYKWRMYPDQPTKIKMTVIIGMNVWFFKQFALLPRIVCVVNKIILYEDFYYH